jgi:hypothetical protein
MDVNNDLYVMMQSYPPDSPAWSLVDAFDAVTNGIDNPESLARMEEVTEPQLQPWKHLIHGIRSLYTDDIQGCEAALETIDDNSAPGTLKPLFKAWIARQGTDHRETIFEELSEAYNAVINLYHRLLVEPHPLSLLAEQAEEALNHGLAEQFVFLAEKIMKSLGDQKRGDGPLLALRFAWYCLDLLDKAGYGDSDFFSVILKTLGEADGFCVLGFALIGKDDEAAAAALEKALASEGGRFLDDAMASLIAEFLPALKERSMHTRPAPAGRFNQAAGGYPMTSGYSLTGSSQPKGRRNEGSSTSGQLELFGETYG